MATQAKELTEDNQYRFSDVDVSVFRTHKGLSPDLAGSISQHQGEPEWMLKFRLKVLDPARALQRLQHRPKRGRGARHGGGERFQRGPSTAVQAHYLLHQSPRLVDEHHRLSEVVGHMAQHERRLAIVTHEDETVVGMITPRELADFRLAHRSAVHA